ncbi:hypothetical protein K491DRAFT_604601 [Lophiostoma macrostomum CBS 122681]|uniref:3-carboxymuconate cyclase n=1 Tax=Lophiostoma macrostomum CBS 122681 TaxID=1314788 RepID=A0A6A6SXX5_9PLEO|nr:hypothetical protein K491DRAFT_604601 [Lophiostoma macrostomum CBS 122681]
MRLSLTPFTNAFLVVTVVASPLPSVVSSIGPHRRHSQGIATGQALYFLTNDNQNSVAAVAINADGTLGNATLTATGGSGSVSVDANGTPAPRDALSSQSSLTLVGHNIFAVNAGSNTVSFLTIDRSNPGALHLVGQPAKLPGTFPTTVSASRKHSLVCVGMTGSRAGISCGTFDRENGIGEMDALRPFEIGQSDPPVGPLNTLSQTFFSTDESLLFTTVKGDPTVNKTGFFSVFPVQQGGNPNACNASSNTSASSLSTQDTRSSPPGTSVLFGSQQIPNAKPPQIFVTDAAFGADILTLDPTSLHARLTANQSIEGQTATCWATISPLTGTAFVTDVGVNRIVEMSLKDASIVSTIDLRQDKASRLDSGLIDLKAAGRFVYALSPGNGTVEAAISVVDVQSKKLVQHAGLGDIGVTSRAQGMAILV